MKLDGGDTSGSKTILGRARANPASAAPVPFAD
jgi:hypothetical protein